MKTFIALATIEKDGDLLQVLPPECHGASGWMAAKADTEERAAESISSELAQIGLRLIELDQMIEVSSSDEVADHDSHLAENMETWETGKKTVWGTMHTYVGDGEA